MKLWMVICSRISSKLQAYGHPFPIWYFYVVILYKLTANAVLHLKDFLQSFYTNRCRQNHFCLKFNTHDIDLRNQKETKENNLISFCVKYIIGIYDSHLMSFVWFIRWGSENRKYFYSNQSRLIVQYVINRYNHKCNYIYIIDFNLCASIFFSQKRPLMERED